MRASGSRQGFLVLALTLALAASACSGAADDDTVADTDAGDDTTDTTDDTADDATDDTGDDAGDAAPAGDQELTIVSAEPQSGLDTSIAVTQASLRLVELIFEPLLDYDEDNELIPALAESWELSDDGLSYDITLRENAMFSDGSPITADDVQFSLERAAGEGAALESALAVMESIEVIDDRTVTVTLSEPSRVFLNAIATTGSAGILSQEAVEADPEYFTQPTVTSGPWTLVSYTPQDRAVLQANEHYWNEGFPQISTINYTFGSDTTAMAAALESGTVDMTYNMRPEDGIRLRDSGAISMYEAPSAGLIGWGLDKTQPPFDDVRVRQAVAYMVPREARLEVCWSGIGPVSYGDLIYETSPLSSEGDQRFDVDQDEALATASALLDDAGWVMGDDGIRVADGVEGSEDGAPFAITVPFENTWAQARCNTEMLQQTLLPLGVDVSPEAYDGATFWTDVGSGSFTMYHAGNSYATDDIHIADSYMCEGAVIDLMARWCNEEVDELIRQAQQTSDIDEATDLYREVQDIVLDEQPIIVTGAQYAVIGTNPALEGYYTRADSSNRGLIQASLPE